MTPPANYKYMWGVIFLTKKCEVSKAVPTMKHHWNSKLGQSNFFLCFSAELWKKIECSLKKKPLNDMLHRNPGCTTLGKWHAAFQARRLQLKSLVKLGKKDVAKAVPRAMGDPATTLRDMKQDWLNKIGEISRMTYSCFLKSPWQRN